MLKQRLLEAIRHKKKRDFFIYGVGQAFNLLSPLIVAPYIVATCREQGFGKVGLGFALSLFLILIVDYAYDIKGMKLAAENRDNPKRLGEILYKTIFTKIVLFTIAMAIAVLLISFVPFLKTEPELFYLSMTIVFAQVFTPVWFLQGIEDFSMVSMVNIGSKTLYVLLVFMFVKHEQDYIYVNFFLGASSLLFNLVGIAITSFRYNFKVILPTRTEIGHTLRTDFSFCLSQLALSVRQLSPLVLTGYFLGYFYAGQYKIIEQVITLFRTFLQVFLKFFYPSLCYKLLTDVKQAYGYWKKYTAFSLVGVILALVVMFVFAPEIVRYFNAAEHSIDTLASIFRMALCIPLLMALNLPLEQLMFALGKDSTYIRIAIGVAALNVILIAALIQQYLLSGVIFSIIVSETVFVALYFNHTRNQIRREMPDGGTA